MIKPIETMYHGIRFRSRLEARLRRAKTAGNVAGLAPDILEIFQNVSAPPTGGRKDEE